MFVQLREALFSTRVDSKMVIKVRLCNQSSYLNKTAKALTRVERTGPEATERERIIKQGESI